MAIDLRARATCTLGDLISASISDEYVQNNGLIKTSGSCEINGLIKPDIGTTVKFYYDKFGITRQVPRQLKVLSSFANPFTGITSVELGCQLTYMQDMSEQKEIDALSDPDNQSFTEEDKEIVVVPISANAVAQECLQKIGLSGTTPLTNKFSVEKFDLSNGYVNTLSELLVSESYCGYVDMNGSFQVFSLENPSGDAVLIQQSDLVDAGPLGFGQLPGSPVVVTYSTLKLENPDNQENEEDKLKRNWEYDEQYGVNTEVILNGRYFGGGQNEWEATYVYTPKTTTITVYDSWDRVVTRTTIDETILADANSSYAITLVNFFGNQLLPQQIITKKSVTSIEYKKKAPVLEPGVYPDGGINRPEEGYDEVLRETTTAYEPEVLRLGSLSVQYYDAANEDLDQLDFSDETISQITTVTTETYSRDMTVGTTNGVIRLGNFPITKTITKTQKIFGQTARGQKYIAQRTDEGEMASDLMGAIDRIVDAGIDIRTFSGREAVFQGRPNSSERAKSSLANGGDPNNGYRTESSSETEVFYTEEAGARRIEFSMPYAPDDTFVKTGSGENATFSAVASDAPQKAALFGRVQNKLLFGSRYGIGIQLSPEKLPTAPYSKIAIQAKGITGIYATNGTSWVIDSNGIIASTDAVFIGAVGKA